MQLKQVKESIQIKELQLFREKFVKLCNEEGVVLPIVTIDDVKNEDDIY